MADDPFDACEALDDLIADLMAKVKASDLPEDIRELLQKTLRAGRKDVLKQLRSGQLTGADWPAIETEFTRLLQVCTAPAWTLSNEAVEKFVLMASNEAFQTKQGTTMPDFDALYQYKAEMDRKCAERGRDIPPATPS